MLAVLGAQKISLAKTLLSTQPLDVWSNGGDRETNKPTHCLDKSCSKQKHRVLSMKRGVMIHITNEHNVLEAREGFEISHVCIGIEKKNCKLNLHTVIKCRLSERNPSSE